MKQLFSYTLFIVTLIISITAISTSVCNDYLSIPDNRLADISNTATIPLEKDYSFNMLDIPFIPVGLNKISNPGVPISVIKAGNNSHCKLKSYFLRLTLQQLSTNRDIYISLCSQKEKDGYYLFTLRKLLI